MLQISRAQTSAGNVPTPVGSAPNYLEITTMSAVEERTAEKRPLSKDDTEEVEVPSKEARVENGKDEVVKEKPVKEAEGDGEEEDDDDDVDDEDVNEDSSDGEGEGSEGGDDDEEGSGDDEGDDDAEGGEESD